MAELEMYEIWFPIQADEESIKNTIAKLRSFDWAGQFGFTPCWEYRLKKII
jgi:hypothetical protein